MIKYERRNMKEKFDMLEHSKQIPFLEFFECKCDSRKSTKQNFEPHLWNYDNRHNVSQCQFRSRCEYFKLLQSVDKSLPAKQKLGSLNKKGSLMRFKKLFHTLKPDYDIYLWVKNLNNTSSSVYKDEIKLLKDFKTYIFRKRKKKKINVSDIIKSVKQRLDKFEEKLDSFQLKSPEYHPKSLSL